ncbi:MAG TPA: DUF1496 domain-containing protein [Cellvibrio sp.]|nr:DUF1496 domain-containing protein [Cellvibrio sp.]
MFINKIGLVAAGMLMAGLAAAHEGHDHEGLSKAETVKQAKEGKLCILDDKGNSLGAVVQKDGKIYRCVKAYGKNLQPQTEAVWIELKMEGRDLRTLP